jgi:two-component system, chemotaxis family, sensor kinase CheA
MSIEDAELLKEFVVESQEHLSDVENQLLSLESQGEQMDISLVNTVFRAVHSIKGAAGFLGLETLQSLAHREEEVLNKLRNNELRPTSVVISTLLKATDRLKGLLVEIEESNGQDVSDHLVALERILNGEIDPTFTFTHVATDTEPTPVDALSADTLREFLVESYDNLEQLERDLMTLERIQSSDEIINSAFRNIHTIKGTAGFLGFAKLEQIAHVAENLLGSIRSGQVTMDTEICGGLFKTIDAARTLLRNIERQKSEGTDNFESLTNLLSGLLPSAASTSERAKPIVTEGTQPSPMAILAAAEMGSSPTADQASASQPTLSSTGNRPATATVDNSAADSTIRWRTGASAEPDSAVYQWTRR